jgi:hypothetical protein
MVGLPVRICHLDAIIRQVVLFSKKTAAEANLPHFLAESLRFQADAGIGGGGIALLGVNPEAVAKIL